MMMVGMMMVMTLMLREACFIAAESASLRSLCFEHDDLSYYCTSEIAYELRYIAGNLGACSLFGGSWLSVIGLLLNRSDHFVTYMKKTIPDPSTFFRVPVEGTYSFFLCIMY